MKIHYKSGKESKKFGDNFYILDKEIPLPGKPISKIDFHKGMGYLDKYYAEILGGLTIHFRDGTSQKVGSATDSDFKSVVFNKGQYWVGLMALENYHMHYQVQVLTINWRSREQQANE